MSTPQNDSQDWNADSYHEISAPQQAWAREQLMRLELTGTETVLDAGCGSGKITEWLVRMVPEGRVYAVDLAPSMVEHTRALLGEHATVLCQDLTELELPEQVDAVFSNAVFHWVPNHPKLFASLARALRAGGQLVAQCGGAGNVASLQVLTEEVAREDRFAPYFEGWRGPWNYVRPDVTIARLEACGFTGVQAWLEERPTPIDEPEPFLRDICLPRHLDRLPGELREPFTQAVLAGCAQPFVLDYVRLNMVARRADRTTPTPHAAATSHAAPTPR